MLDPSSQRALEAHGRKQPITAAYITAGYITFG
jgi:hypothetical protein